MYESSIRRRSAYENLLKTKLYGGSGPQLRALAKQPLKRRSYLVDGSANERHVARCISAFT